MTSAVAESRAREHPQLDGIRERVRYVVGLMVAHEWERGRTAPELAKAWRVTLSCVENYSAEAARHLEYLDEREYWLRRIRYEADVRLGNCEDQHFAGIARVAADTVGGFEQRHKVEHSLQERNPAELAAGALEYVEQHLDGLPGVHERILAMAERIRGNRAILTDGTETTEHPSEKRHDPVD